MPDSLPLKPLPDKDGNKAYVLEETVTVNADDVMTRTFPKKLASWNAAALYAKLALETYSWAKVEIIAIDESLYKYKVVVSKK